MYPHICIFTGYRLCRRPLRLEPSRIRCLELHVALDGDLWAWMAMTLGSILEPLASFGSLLGRLWVACGLQWVRQGAPMSYLALLCRREHQSEAPGGPKGSMWGLKVCRAEKPCGPLWPRFATSCGPYRRIVDQILHHPALAAAGMSHPGLGCWRPGSSWAAWADALLLGLGF